MAYNDKKRCALERSDADSAPIRTEGVVSGKQLDGCALAYKDSDCDSYRNRVAR